MYWELKSRALRGWCCPEVGRSEVSVAQLLGTQKLSAQNSHAQNSALNIPVPEKCLYPKRILHLKKFLHLKIIDYSRRWLSQVLRLG